MNLQTKFILLVASLLLLFSIFIMQRKIMNKKEITKREGIFYAHDKQGIPIELAWYIRSAPDADFANILADIADVSANAFTSVEVNFLKAHPEAVQKDEYFKAVKPFFDKGSDKVNWENVANKMHTIIEQIFTGDLSMLNPDWLFVIVEAKDKEQHQLGAMQCLILPEYEKGDIKVTSIAVEPKAQGRGIGRLLMASILNIIPGIKRIFLNTRITNSNAIHAYQAWGFIEDTQETNDPFIQFKEDWINLEYNISESDRLQKTAEQIKSKN